MASRVIVRALGTAQDGGIPQLGCTCKECEAASLDARLRRTASCLLLDLPDEGIRFLVDATPDIKQQLERLGPRIPNQMRSPVDGVLLTHAHVGHYGGLYHFGKEVASTRNLPVWCTPHMGQFLTSHAPWSQLVSLSNISLRTELGSECRSHLSASLSASATWVPHRNEFADTVAITLHGPARRLLYLPDIDDYRGWDLMQSTFEAADVILIDGTFFSPTELGLQGRDQKSVPHPPIPETMDLLQHAVDAGKQVYFTHLNHTNPAQLEGSAERRAIVQRGFRVLAEDELITL